MPTTIYPQSHQARSSDNDLISHATEFTRRTQPPAYNSSCLHKPVAIPQVTFGIGAAFARCWAPAVSPFNVSEGNFVEFIDNLNIVATASPPLQVLDLVGGALGMVPHHLFQLASLGIQVLAKFGTVAVSKSRTDMYMKAINLDYFAPRGLRVTIVTWDALIVSLRLPYSAQSLAPVSDETINYSVFERRLELLKPYIAELNFDVPPIAQQTTVLAKVSAGQVQRQTAKAQKNMLSKRRKQFEKGEKAQHKAEQKYEERMAKLDYDVEKAIHSAEQDSMKGSRSARKAERKMNNKLAEIKDRKREGERNLPEHTEDIKKGKKLDKESKIAKKGLWILIEQL